MKVVVIGGTGLVGSQVVALLTAQGHEAVPASPDSGVDTVTGAGLAEAFAGADVVVDLTNSRSFADDDVMAFFTTSTANQLAAEAAAGVGHHVALSIVGADRAPESGYLRAKVAQERLIHDGPVPWTVVRATQFYEFLPAIADSATSDGVVTLPTGAFQPLASSDVAAAVAQAAVAPASSTTIEVAGPERSAMDAVVRWALAAKGDPRTVVGDPEARYFGTHLDETTIVPVGDDAHLASTTLAQWTEQRAAAVAG
ncbi:SDR family oxidoreductase [Xylanimonas protaetiae]|uniref:SDR family oxidoreductase n=1 Tax=Xylanimonas protaetiae TaxID=2509457 RepID=A0A4P6F832_9MICO|nr:SDR family oxidoreductase [Xylanimonas protaetiae]QAY71033.1 SDR family oxidoreductase [Xylanimonas protaetiae]